MKGELTVPYRDIIVPEYHWALPLPDSPEMRAAFGYRMTLVTDTTSLMDRRFGLDLERPGKIIEEAAYQLKFAMLFSPFSAESTRVAEYFVWWANNFNFFHALPFEEIPDATDGKVSWRDLQCAVDEGYVDLVDFPVFDVQVAQLTPKFGSYTLPHDRRDIP